MPLVPQTIPWYDRLATLQQEYSYPWHSQLDPWHGEDIYRVLIHHHLHVNMDVLDVACAQGEVALEIAPGCRSVVGYDRIAAWITLAQQQANERGLTNTTFICHDSSAAVNDGQVRLPGSASAYDLLICSKGPFHWIEGARRVAIPMDTNSPVAYALGSPPLRTLLCDSPMSTHVYLLRHAETAAPKVFHGFESDIDLSERGLRLPCL